MTVYRAELRRMWWLILLAVLLAGGTAFARAQGQDPTYESRTVLFVGQPGVALAAAGDLTVTYAQLAFSSDVFNAPFDALGPDSHDMEVRVESDSGRRSVTLIVQDDDRELAARGADLIAAALIRYAAENAATAANAAPPADGSATTATTIAEPEAPLVDTGLHVIQPAVPGETPVAPNVPAATGAGALAGLLGAVGVIAAVGTFDTRARAGRRAAQARSLRYFGRIGGDIGGEGGGEAARRIAIEVDGMVRSREVAGRATIAVLTCGATAGPLHVGRDLVRSLALSHRAVLVDATRPDGTVEVREPTGRITTTLAEPARPQDVDGLLEAVRAHGDVAVVVLPDLEASPAALVWGRACDGVVLAVDEPEVPVDAVLATVDRVLPLRVPILGVVAVDGRSHRTWRGAPWRTPAAAKGGT